MTPRGFFGRALQGWAGPALLDTYKIERKPVALYNLDEATDMFWRTKALLPGDETISEDSPKGARLRELFAKTLIESNVQRQLDVEGLALGYHYDPSPIIVPDGTPPPPAELQVYTPTARLGSRAPHAWLKDGRSTLDLFGNGFTLLRFGGSSADVSGLVEAGRAAGVPLTVCDIVEICDRLRPPPRRYQSLKHLIGFNVQLDLRAFPFWLQQSP